MTVESSAGSETAPAAVEDNDSSSPFRVATDEEEEEQQSHDDQQQQQQQQQHRPLKKRRLSDPEEHVASGHHCEDGSKKNTTNESEAAQVSDDEDERRDEEDAHRPLRARREPKQDQDQEERQRSSGNPHKPSFPILAFEAGRPVGPDTFRAVASNPTKRAPTPVLRPMPALPTPSSSRLGSISWIAAKAEEMPPIEHHRSPTPTPVARRKTSSRSSHRSEAVVAPSALAGSAPAFASAGGTAGYDDKTMRLLAYLTKKRRRILNAAPAPRRCSPPVAVQHRDRHRPSPSLSAAAAPPTPAFLKKPGAGAVPASPKLPSAAAAAIAPIAPAPQKRVAKCQWRKLQMQKGAVSLSPEAIAAPPQQQRQLSTGGGAPVVPAVARSSTPVLTALRAAAAAAAAVGRSEHADVLQAALALASFSPRV